MTENHRIELVVFGRVQGVAFRWSTREKADSLGLRGWVRNEPDGSVRIVAEGSASALDRFRSWCAVGPPRAVVERVRVVEEGPARGEIGHFRVRT